MGQRQSTSGAASAPVNNEKNGDATTATMMARAMEKLELRAEEAEAKLASLESAVKKAAMAENRHEQGPPAAAAAVAGGKRNGPGVKDEKEKALSTRYVKELLELRKVLVEAQNEQDALKKRVEEVESKNAKLEYRIGHLKKALGGDDDDDGAVKE